MARLARYANVQPDQFGRLTPARTRELDAAAMALVNDEWRAHGGLAIEQARLIATLIGGR